MNRFDRTRGLSTTLLSTTIILHVGYQIAIKHYEAPLRAA